MNETERPRELSDTILEIGRKLHPRRYRRFKDLRSSQEASMWAKTLDWRNNPYDRFLLRREILRQLESAAFYEGRRNVYTFCSREEIAAEVDRLIDQFPEEYAHWGVFGWVLTNVRWHLAFRHGRVWHDRLAAAVAQMPSKQESKQRPTTK
jgi:hypothetical protein